ncbi:MAG: hypothetical protein DRP11_05470, partial [Candidatus Aenigmatarchaeota archaeon]
MVRKHIRKFLGLEKEGRKLEPEKYVVGVSSGIPSVARETITQRAVNVSFKGAEIIQIDAEYPSSFTPHDIEELKNMKKNLGVRLAMHGAVNVTLPMTTAEKFEYKRVQDDLKEYIKIAGKIGMEYVLFHTSILPSPILLREVRRMRSELVGPDGKEIKEWLKKGRKKLALDWYVEDILSKIGIETEITLVRQSLVQEGKKPEELEQTIRGMSVEERKKRVKDVLKDYVMEKEDIGGSEWDAYMIVAWVMYETKDSIWMNICNGKKPTTLVDEGNEDLLVDAVAGKYLQGHCKNVSKLLDKHKVDLIFETPDARSPQYRGYYRLYRPRFVYYVIKAINDPHVFMCIDFEHLAGHGVDLIEEIKKMPPGSGKLVRVLHIGGHPSPAHLHRPVEKGEIDLYKLLWELRKRGFEEGYVIFEMGGYEEPQRWLKSVPNIKEMMM